MTRCAAPSPSTQIDGRPGSCGQLCNLAGGVGGGSGLVRETIIGHRDFYSRLSVPPRFGASGRAGYRDGKPMDRGNEVRRRDQWEGQRAWVVLKWNQDPFDCLHLYYTTLFRLADNLTTVIGKVGGRIWPGGGGVV